MTPTTSQEASAAMRLPQGKTPSGTLSEVPLVEADFAASPPSSTRNEDRTLALEKELARVRKRADARGKEAEALRSRVQELEPEVRRLANELEKRRQREHSRSPLARRRQPSPSRMPLASDVALRIRLAAAENRASILQIRCDQLELGRTSFLGSPRGQGAATERDACCAHDAKAKNFHDAEHHALIEDSKAKQIKRQLEVAERRVKNSLYINEAHENLVTKATEREKEANARAAELGRRLDRALEKLESIERREMIFSAKASCVRDEESIYLTHRELRAHQMDPELYLPVNTAKRRQLARAELRLQQLQRRHESQAAALRLAQAIDKSHCDLRTAAGLGDVAETAKCLKSGISVNVPDQHGLSAFLYACGQGNAELIRMLVDAGGDVRDGDGTITGLIIAARKGALEVVQTLLEAGADVDARDSAGGAALHAAALGRHVDVARVLLDAGSDCNSIDQGNNTPLHMLASVGPPGDALGSALVTLLLEWGASAEIKNSEGLTPVAAALATKNRAIVLAYRAFFGDDSGRAVGTGREGAAVPAPPAPTVEIHTGTKRGIPVAASKLDGNAAGA